MPGTRTGGMKARETNYKKHGKDFYREIGRKGGKRGHTGGFASNPELAQRAGRKGGKKSDRTGVKNGEGTSKSAIAYRRRKEREKEILNDIQN